MNTTESILYMSSIAFRGKIYSLVHLLENKLAEHF